jgi:signal recognition particle subunit SRP68
MDTTPATTPAKVEEKEAIQYAFSMEILPRIKAAQLQNGLRHGDYQRYRFYCSKRVRRIRRGIKFLHGKRFHKKSIELKDVNDVRYLEMALVLAERAWAYSMQLKEDSEKNSRAKFHANRKLSKAVKWGDQLARLCDHAADDKTKLEAHVRSDTVLENFYRN